MLALAPGGDPVIRALGAPAGGLPNLLTAAVRDVSALHDTVALLIGTNEGERVLPTWAEVAPAGWGASHAVARIDTVRRNCCPHRAVALIGHCDASAALLGEMWDIAYAMRRWGKVAPDNPTAWMDELTPAGRDRLLDALRNTPNATRVRRLRRSVARIRHVASISTLMHCAKPGDLAALLRLTVAAGKDDAWTEIMRLVRANLWDAIHVVIATLWGDVQADARTLILSAAARSAICAAIAFACSVRNDAPPTAQAPPARSSPPSHQRSGTRWRRRGR